MTSLNGTVRLAQLADRARQCKPRLFALHGLHAVSERAILGWGMDFTDRDDAVFYLPTDSVTYHTVSAERAALRYSMLGDIELTWLDEPR